MSLNVAQMTAKLRKISGIDINDLSDADVLLNLNISFWEIMDLFEFREKEQTTTFNTVAGTILYPAPTPFDAIQGLSIEDVSSKQHTILERMDVSEYENDFVNNTDARSKPIKYYREGTNVGLWPTPDAVYTITEKYLTTLADLAINAPSCPQSWHEIILFGGIYRSFLDVGDKTSAAYFRKEQANMSNMRVPTKAKEEKMDNKYAGLNVLRRLPSDEVSAGRRIN